MDLIFHPLFYQFIQLLNSKQGSQTFVYTREAHESHSQQTGCYQSDGHTVHTLRDVYQAQLFADTGKQHHRQGKTDSGSKGIDDTGQQIVIVLDNQDGNTKDTAVGCNQREEHTECLIKSR